MRVLLVDDDRMIGEALCVALRSNGISVDWVRNAADAERAMRDGGHALVLLDVGLPSADGLDLLRSARAGTITDEELERERGGSGLRYSFHIKNGSVTQEVGVDAKTGRVLENKKEGPNPD